MSHITFDAAINIAKDALSSLSDILTKAEASPVAANIPNARLIEDMFPFSFQVHVATNCASRLADHANNTVPHKTYNYDAHTYEQMHARIKEVQAALEAVADVKALKERDNTPFTFAPGPGSPEMTVEVWQYANGYAVPNIFFHVTTAYNIARKEGVVLGKRDYINPFASCLLPKA